MIILLPLFFTMCGGSLSLTGNSITGGGGGGNNSNSNSNSGLPIVVSVTPANNDASVDVASAITATFSVAMAPATINATTFTLHQGAIAVSGTVTYSGKTATFTPTSALSPHSTYIALVSTGAKDTLGNALAGDYAWVFTTTRDYSAWMDVGINYEAPAGGNAYYPSVLYDVNGFGAGTPKYYMWYSDGNGSTFLVSSANGLQWGSPTTMSGIVNSHHTQVLYDASCFGVTPCIDGVTTKYRMWFWDIGAPTIYSISSMATAESADGINWVNQQAVTQNPAAKLVQDPDLGVGWNRGTYGPVALFYRPGASNTGTEPWGYQYVMYYDGTDGAHEDTGLAYSTDGLYWNAYTANPILGSSLIGGWDCYSSVYGAIYKDAVGFHYFYSGKGQDDGSGNCIDPASNNFEGIGSAFSTDGEAWIRSISNPIFDISDGVYYRNERIYTPSVVDDGTGVLRMYYTAKEVGGPKKIGLAVLH
jgi:hypothetical protein